MKHLIFTAILLTGCGSPFYSESESNSPDGGKDSVSIYPGTGGASSPDNTNSGGKAGSNNSGGNMQNSGGKIGTGSSGGNVQDSDSGSNTDSGTASCTDGMNNGEETGVDCGGPVCPACHAGDACVKNSDCLSLICGENSICTAAVCDDNVKNGLETDVDCGGPTCKSCTQLGDNCLVPGDCSTHTCLESECAPSDPGTIVVNWTIASNIDSSDCTVHEAANIDIMGLNKNGFMSSCSNFAMSVSLAPDTYNITAQMLNQNGAPVSTKTQVMSVTVVAGQTEKITIDFPTDAAWCGTTTSILCSP